MVKYCLILVNIYLWNQMDFEKNMSQLKESRLSIAGTHNLI